MSQTHNHYYGFRPGFFTNTMAFLIGIWLLWISVVVLMNNIWLLPLAIIGFVWWNRTRQRRRQRR